MKKLKKLLQLFALFAVVFGFSLSAQAAENLQFSNASIEISNTGCVETEGQPDVCSFTVSGSFDSSTASDKKYMVILASYDFDNTLMGVSISEQYSVQEGANTFSYAANPIEDAKKLKAYLLTEDLAPICTPAQKVHSLKILAIGNSFSRNAMSWLYQIAEDQGVDKIALGNLYIGGCSLATHWGHASETSDNPNAYTYFKNTTGTWENTTEQKMLKGIQDEEWDFITLQQASGDSGNPDTYEPYLSNLIDYVNTNKTNPKAKLAWHMTWAYKQGCTHEAFPTYNSDQSTMYKAIVDTVKSKVYTHNEFDFVIPAGTAIQNARTCYYGDNLTLKDGYHLSAQQGCYIAGLTWFYKITGMPIDTITYAPNTTLLMTHQQKVIKESVQNAILYPEECTPSKYTTPTACYDFENDYTELDYKYTANAFWNSTSSYDMQTPNNDTSKNFIATKQFTRDELPIGTVIVVDAGYKYRPEGWQTENSVNNADRPGDITSNVVEINDAWWTDSNGAQFKIRAFNIAKSSGSAGTNNATNAAELATHFRIYVPKD